MTEFVTDIAVIAISIKNHGNVVISNLTYPSIVFAGQPFDIEYDATNNSDGDTCYGKIYDDTITYDSWNEILASGQTKHVVANISGLNEELNATLDVGYTTE